MVKVGFAFLASRDSGRMTVLAVCDLGRQSHIVVWLGSVQPPPSGPPPPSGLPPLTLNRAGTIVVTGSVRGF
jgi:hypothetical protein